MLFFPQKCLEIGSSNEEALDIITTVRDACEGPKLSTPGKSALELLEAEVAQTPISTFCSAFDTMLGGGVPLTKITEFCGAPGVGKTQLGMQLAINVQMPRSFGGVGGEAIYIDTEGSFIADRAAQIADAMVSRLRAHAANGSSQESLLHFC